MCIPKIRANARNWPILQENHLAQIKLFFTWLSKQGLLENEEQLTDAISKKVADLLTKKED
jgi:hypothetical protein